MSKEQIKCNKKKILIVDEEASYRELLREAFRDNFVVIETESCKEAFSLVNLNMPELIIVDLDMPDNKGVLLCEELKEDSDTREIPVIVMTSLTQKDDILQGLEAGASDYITKPFSIPEVLARVESHLRTQDFYDELEHKDLLMLLELSETISVTRNPNAILRLIVRKMSKIIDVDRCSIISFSKERLIVKASNDLEKGREIKLDINRYPELRASIETKKDVIINDIKTNPLMASVRAYTKSLDYNSIVVIPLLKRESVIGTFLLRTVSSGKGGVSERVYKLCHLVANIAATALENATLYESMKNAQEYLEEISIRDDLTKLYNRRHFYRKLRNEFSRVERYGEDLSLVFFDIDDFKKINDTYGHAQGDKLLVQIGSLLKNLSRECDLPARVGGDEFAMLLPSTNKSGALNLAQRIFKTIQGKKIEGLDDELISISVGVSNCIDNKVKSAEELVKLSDDAMYQSKTNGKGQVSQV
ncbi:MAG: diguanylate cyclase [Desulfuromonadales bacterium]|nr:diguanylate cyclase [Desulfuromonadales bacterium]